MTIKEAREKTGLTQAQLADKIGVLQQTVGKWESGERKPKYETLAKIASACNMDIAVLLPSHGRKLRRAKDESGYAAYPQTCRDIFSQIPDKLVERLTSGQLAVVSHLINQAYQAGRASTGAEMLDTNCIWIASLDKVIEWDEVGAEYKTVESMEPVSPDMPGKLVKVVKSIKMKPGKIVLKFIDNPTK